MTVLQTALAPFTLKGFYLLTWGTALGTNVWYAVENVSRGGSQGGLLTFHLPRPSLSSL